MSTKQKIGIIQEAMNEVSEIWEAFVGPMPKPTIGEKLRSRYYSLFWWLGFFLVTLVCTPLVAFLDGVYSATRDALTKAGLFLETDED